MSPRSANGVLLFSYTKFFSTCTVEARGRYTPRISQTLSLTPMIDCQYRIQSLGWEGYPTFLTHVRGYFIADFFDIEALKKEMVSQIGAGSRGSSASTGRTGSPYGSPASASGRPTCARSSEPCRTPSRPSGGVLGSGGRYTTLGSAWRPGFFDRGHRLRNGIREVCSGTTLPCVPAPLAGSYNYSVSGDVEVTVSTLAKVCTWPCMSRWQTWMFFWEGDQQKTCQEAV